MKNPEELVRLYEAESGKKLLFWTPVQRVITRGVLGLSTEKVLFLTLELADKLKVEQYAFATVKELQRVNAIISTRLTMLLTSGGRSEFDVKKEDAAAFQQKFHQLRSGQGSVPASSAAETAPKPAPADEAQSAEQVSASKPAATERSVQPAAATGGKAELVIDDNILSLVRKRKYIQAVNEIREKHHLSLQEAKDLLDRIEKSLYRVETEVSTRVEPYLDEEIRNLLKNHRKIEAIKKFRDKFKVSLQQAKEFLDREEELLVKGQALAAAPAKIGRTLKQVKLKEDVLAELLILNNKLKSTFSPLAMLGCFVMIFTIIIGLVIGFGVFKSPGAALVFAFILGSFGFSFFGLTQAWGASRFFRKEIRPRLEEIMRKEKVNLENLEAAVSEILPKNTEPLRDQIHKLLYQDRRR